MSSIAPAPLEKPKGRPLSKGPPAQQQQPQSRKPDDESALMQSIASKQVIGRRGQNIIQLQKLAGAAATTSQPVRVSVVGPEHSESPPTFSELDWSDAQWTPVVIRADPCAALTAAHHIQTVQCQNSTDGVVLDIPLARNKHAAIIGKRGITVATLSADHNVRIMVPNKDARQDVIQLEGDLDNVKRCLQQVLVIASKATAIKSPSSSQVTATVMTDILPSQTKLRSVGRKTDTTIKKRKVESADNNTTNNNSTTATWQLLIIGSTQDQVNTAVAILEKWKDDTAKNGAAADGSDTGTPSSLSGRKTRGGRPTSTTTAAAAAPTTTTSPATTPTTTTSASKKNPSIQSSRKTKVPKTPPSSSGGGASGGGDGPAD